MTPLLSLSVSHFPESPVLFRLCSDNENAIIMQVQTRTVHQHVSPLIKHTNWITTQRGVIQNFLMFPISPHWSWEKHGYVPFTSKTGPGTSSATLDKISRLLGKLGATQQWDTGTSTCFCKLFCTCLLLGCFHSCKSVSGQSLMVQQNYLSGSLWREKFSFFSQQPRLPKSTLRAFTTPSMTTLSFLMSTGTSALRQRTGHPAASCCHVRSIHDSPIPW